MSKKKSPSKKLSREERQDLLERLWAAHTLKLVEKLESTAATEIDAATFNSAAKLLADNGITADALGQDHGQAGSTLAAQARDIGPFDDTLNQYARALAAPVPVPPNTEETLRALKRLEDN